MGHGREQSYKKQKLVVGSFGLGYLSSERRQYSASVVQDLGVISLIVTRGCRLSNCRGPGPDIYVTGTAEINDCERHMFSRYCSLAGLLSAIVTSWLLGIIITVNKLKSHLRKM